MTLSRRLAAALDATAALPVRLAGDMDGPAAPGTAAAVLIAITERDEPGLILTLRPETMRRHAGQIAFPGGRTDPGDSDAVATALREAHEEIALSARAVDVVGTLADYRTVTGYTITPVIGVIAPDLPLVPHDEEVAAVFEVPLAHVLDPANQVARAMTVAGATRHYIEIGWNDRRIWGATAAMLVNLSVRLRW